MATRNGSKNQSSSNGKTTSGSGESKGTTSASSRRSRTSAASAAGTTTRSRLRPVRAKATPPKKDIPIVEPITRPPKDIPVVEPVISLDEARAAAAAGNRRAFNAEGRVDGIRSQIRNLEQAQRDRLVKAAQLAAIAIVFITFVLQNAEPVNVHFLFFGVNIRLIWVIFGCGILGTAAGYLIGRPDKSLRALVPPKEKVEKVRRRMAGR